MSESAPRKIALLFLIDHSGKHDGDASTPAVPRLLLGLKKTSFGAGKIVGVGGHIEAGETPSAAAVREMSEEASVLVREGDLRPAGIIRFRFPNLAEWNMDTWLFTAETWQGTPEESEELAPKWFALDRLPLDRMWQDAEHWVPRIAAGDTVDLTITMARDNEGIDKVFDAGA